MNLQKVFDVIIFSSVFLYNFFNINYIFLTVFFIKLPLLFHSSEHLFNLALNSPYFGRGPMEDNFFSGLVTPCLLASFSYSHFYLYNLFLSFSLFSLITIPLSFFIYFFILPILFRFYFHLDIFCFRYLSIEFSSQTSFYLKIS